MKNFAWLPKTLSILRTFGRRSYTSRDFIALCSENGITVKILPMFEDGIYYCVNGRHYIAISSMVSRERREFAAWHEFGHFLQNFHKSKTVANFCNVVTDEDEKLADAFATVAIGNARITGPMDFLKMIMRDK